MKTKLFLTILFTTFFLNAQSVSDSNFEEYLETHNGLGGEVSIGSSSSLGDGILGNGFVNGNNISSATFLNLSNLGINSLGEDLFLFDNLVQLFVAGNNLTSLDITLNNKLQVLFCSNNNLETLDLSGNSLLNIVSSNNNNINNLILPNNPEDINTLECNNNNLDELNVTAITSLKKLLCDNNKIEVLDLSENKRLETLSCTNNNLHTLNIANGANQSLTFFDASGNSDLSCIQIDDVNTIGNNWTKDTAANYSVECNTSTYIPDDNFEQVLIDLGYDDVLDDYVLTSEIEDVTSLIFERTFNSISDLTGIENFKALEVLEVLTLSDLGDLDFSNNLNLRRLNLANDNITSLNLTNNVLLEELLLSGNPDLRTLNLSNNINLKSLYVDLCSNLEELDITNSSQIEALSIRSTKVSVINTENMPNLNRLEVAASNVSTLNLLNNPNLERLSFHLTSVETVDLSNNNKIEVLEFNSSITNFDTTDFAKLKRLSSPGGGNSLVSLDLSKSVDLEYLYIDDASSLERINLKNGNNTNFNVEGFNFVIARSFKIECVQVDDVAYSTENWKNNQSDGIFVSLSSVSYSELCFEDLTSIPDDNFEQVLIDLGYDDVLDDNVLTNNINTVTSLDIRDKQISDLTGIADFTALEFLDAGNNTLTSLDVSTLSDLNSLISNNNLLETLIINDDLELLVAGGNQLEALDFSNNMRLKEIRIGFNPLTTLNIANGNNENITNIFALETPNLSCIQVDNATFSTDNWTTPNFSFDDANSFSVDCNASLSVNDIEGLAFSLYPNPSIGNITIDVLEAASLKIYNLIGKEVLSRDLTIGKNQFNNLKLTSGIYMLKITSGVKSSTKKLIIN